MRTPLGSSSSSSSSSASRRRRCRLAVAAAIVVALGASGCSASPDEATSGSTARPRPAAAGGDRGWLEEGADDWSEGGAGGSTRKEGRAEADEGAATGRSPAPSGGGEPSTTVPPDAPMGEPADPRLAAGKLDDNEAWEQYLQYRAGAGRAGLPLGPVDVDARRVITVRDAEDAPVRGALVEVLDAEGAPVARVRTHADGRAVTFAAATPASGAQQAATAVVTYRVTGPGGTAQIEVPAEEAAPVLRLEAARPGAAPSIDVVFVIDATGSMGDEIERLKANVAAVAGRAKALPGSPKVRFGMTVYRDAGDAFVTRTFDLTDDIGSFTAALREVQAGGGGDTPEAVEPALADALTKPTWSTDPGTIKLAFLVADAPPHLPGAPGQEAPAGGDDGPNYLATARRYAEAGIELVPVASSNTDELGESVFRELALVTGAPFLFLTYGPDGRSPGTERPDLHVPKVDVLALDVLITDVVAERVTATG